MATTSSALCVSRPRFGRPERTGIRANFARDVLGSHTRVEAPYISARIRKELETLEAAAERDGLPLTTHLVFPKLNDTFWVNLIGRDYPSPNSRCWCPVKAIHEASEFRR